jgi:hypothetical protein
MIVNKEVQLQLAFLETEKRALRHYLELKEQEYENLRREIRNHVYESLDEAKKLISKYLEKLAHEACKGAGNSGNDEYSQDFIVDGVEYTATMIFEYGRHDKTYYYIDDSEYSYKLKDGQ